jgi:hypothetical protein
MELPEKKELVLVAVSKKNVTSKYLMMPTEVIHSEEPVAGNLHGGFCGGRKGVICASTRHNIPHELLMKGVEKHCQVSWMLLYIERWLKAPLQKADGTIVERTKGGKVRS